MLIWYIKFIIWYIKFIIWWIIPTKLTLISYRELNIIVKSEILIKRNKNILWLKNILYFGYMTMHD